MNAVLRLNLDVEASEKSGSLRLKRAADSLNKLAPKFKRIVILSHRGRPNGTDHKLSLKSIIKNLSKISNLPITFLAHDPSVYTTDLLNKKGIFALENTRFLSGENENDLSLARLFASFGNIFINDDFATAHRSQSSNVGITRFIKSVPGPIMKDEIKALSKIIMRPNKPFTIIIGGAKISTKLPIIKKLIPKADYILLGGGPGNTALKAAGYDIEESIFEEDLISETKKIITNKKVLYPLDFRVLDKQILDIGPNTESTFIDIINSSKTIIWAGPMGLFEKKAFSKGTTSIAKAIVQNKCFSIAGGGETTSAIFSLGLENKFSYLSTGGGAMLEFLAGKKMPAIQALKIK